MRKVAYVIFVIGIIMIIVGMLIQNNCDNKTPKEYFERVIKSDNKRKTLY